MKNKIIIFTLLTVFLSIGALNAEQSQYAAEVQWASEKIKQQLVDDFDNLVKNFNDEKINTFTDDFKKEYNNQVIKGIVDTFIAKIKENKDNPDCLSNLRKALFIYYGDYFSNDQALRTLGHFVYTLYTLYPQAGLPVKTRIALRNDGYHKEYFLKDTVDNEKRDGMRYYFYSKPVQGPTGLLAMLGFGYTDKRSWGLYLGKKLFGAAAIGGTAALAYFAGKRYHDRQQRRDINEEYNALNQQAPEPQGRFRRFVEGNRKAWQDLENNQPSAIGQFKNIPGAVGGYFFNKPINMAKTVSQGIETKNDMRHNTHKQIMQLKKEEKERLREANKATRSKEMQSQQGVYNPVGSAFDIEGGMLLGTTEYRQELRKQIKQEYADKIKEVKEQLSQDLRDVR